MKFCIAAIATLPALPMPVSSIPPIHTGTCFSAHRSWILRAARYPPTRPGLMLMIRHAPSSIASAAFWYDSIDSSRQIGVRTRRASSAWASTSSSRMGCSIRRRSKGSSAASRSASASVYAVLASTWSGTSPNLSRTARTGSTSQPGLILSLIRR